MQLRYSMEYRILKYFLVVADEENITRASEILHISQPALSRQLMQLEEDLGVKLFERGNRKITLTNEGYLLKRRAQEIISLTTQTENEIRNNSEMVGTINIGLQETMASKAIIPLIKIFNEKYPDIKFNFFSNNTPHIIELLNRGLIDVAMILDPKDLDTYDYVRIPYIDTWGALMHKDHPLAVKEKIEPKDLINEKIFLSHRYYGRAETNKWYGEALGKVKISATYNLISNITLLVEEKLGIAIVLDGVMQFNNNPNLKFIPLEPKETLSSVMAWKNQTSKPEYLNKFINQIKILYNAI